MRKGNLFCQKWYIKRLAVGPQGGAVLCNMLLSRSPGTCSRPLIPTGVADSGWPIADNKIWIGNEVSLREEIFSFVFLELH